MKRKGYILNGDIKLKMNLYLQSPKIRANIQHKESIFILYF